MRSTQPSSGNTRRVLLWRSALAFYQKWGMDLITLDVDGINRARRDLKPTIPEKGSGGIPIRDELELELLP